MDGKTVTVSAPGKLMLSGEWSVLEGAPCIVLAVSRKVYATAREAPKTSITLHDFNITTGAEISKAEVKFAKDDPKLGFTKHAIGTALQYLTGKKIKPKNFTLETRSDISKAVQGSQEKLGFGSSAAATAAILGAVLKLHGVGIETEQEKDALFKLAIIAHYKAQGKIGSGFDVAASVFGGALVYTRFDAEWFAKELGKKKIREVAGEKWPGLSHRNIVLPKGFGIAVGFTGKSASTTELVKKMWKFREEKRAEYDKIIFWLRECTEAMIDAIEGKEPKEVMTLVDENARILRVLGQESGNELEIAEHRKMAEIASRHFASAKFSGAGGGDCSVCVAFDEAALEAVKKEWAENGLMPVDVKVSAEGVKAEK